MQTGQTKRKKTKKVCYLSPYVLSVRAQCVNQTFAWNW